MLDMKRYFWNRQKSHALHGVYNFRFTNKYNFFLIWETVGLPTSFLCKNIFKNLHNECYHNFWKRRFHTNGKKMQFLKIKGHSLNLKYLPLFTKKNYYIVLIFVSSHRLRKTKIISWHLKVAVLLNIETSRTKNCMEF